MPDIVISSERVSDIVWTHFFNIYRKASPSRISDVQTTYNKLNQLRHTATFDTGSISLASAWGLYSIAKFFAPAMVVEIGTFIGRSTLALACGMADAQTGGIIYTCDSENDIQLPQVIGCSIRQFPQTKSTKMLGCLVAEQPRSKIDMLYLDGRLLEGDLAILGELCSPKTIVAFDDFHGIEKGTANAVYFSKAGIIPEASLILPPTEELLQRYGFSGTSTTAILLPSGTISVK